MVTKKYLQLNDIDCYKRSYLLSNFVWKKIINWNSFEKNTIGTQFVRAIDSISANIAEGFGRYGKKDKIKFFHYSHGSIKESLDWNEKAYARSLLPEKDYLYILSSPKILPKDINSLILYINNKLQQ